MIKSSNISLKNGADSSSCMHSSPANGAKCVKSSGSSFSTAKREWKLFLWVFRFYRIFFHMCNSNQEKKMQGMIFWNLNYYLKNFAREKFLLDFLNLWSLDQKSIFFFESIRWRRNSKWKFAKNNKLDALHEHLNCISWMCPWKMFIIWLAISRLKSGSAVDLITF